MADRLNRFASSITGTKKSIKLNANQKEPDATQVTSNKALTDFMIKELTERIVPNGARFIINVITDSDPSELLENLKSNYSKAEIAVFSENLNIVTKGDAELLSIKVNKEIFGDGKLNLILLTSENNVEIRYVQMIKKLIADAPSTTYIATAIKISEMSNYDPKNGKLGNPIKREKLEDGSVYFYELFTVDIKSPKTKKETKTKPSVASGSGITQEERNRAANPVKKPLITMPFDVSRVTERPAGLLVGSEGYQTKFKAYIRSVLEAVVLDKVTGSMKDTLLESLTNYNAMLIWQLAFTHTSANPDPQGNYDQLEAIGDRMLSAAFKDFSAMKYPRITDTELNEYNSRYMSEEVQAPMGNALKMASWVIVDPIVDVVYKFNEDLFESFCGALTRLADIVKTGLGYIMVRHMIENIFGPINYDERYRYGKSITLITQAYNSQHWYGPDQSTTLEIETTKMSHEWVASIDITSENFVSYLQNERMIRGNSGPHITATGIKASARGSTKEHAKELVADMVVERLQNYGVMPKDLVEKDLRRSYLYRSNEDYRNLVEQVLSSTSDQYQRVYIETIKQTSDTDFNKNYTMLVGERRSGTPNTLGILDKLAIQSNVTNGGLTPFDINTALMQKYLSH